MRHRMKVAGVIGSVLLCSLISTPSEAATWKAVSQSELELKAPVVEKDADAEALFWDLLMEDDVSITGAPYVTVTNYVRIKIFTEKGRSERTQVELRYADSETIRGIAARTLKSDGTIVEFDPETIREKTIVKAGGSKVKAKAFALPAVEAGSIVEYRWVEERSGQLTHFKRLDVQRDLPIQVATYSFKPLEIPGFQMRAWASGMESPAFIEGKGGFRTASIRNIPTFRTEPDMLPADMLRRWLLIYYSNFRGTSPEEYWKETGIAVYDENKKFLKARGSLRKVVEPLIAAESDASGRLFKLHSFCREKVRNVGRESSGVTTEERQNIVRQGDPEEVLARGTGTSRQINRLFGALAASAGFDVRIALVGDRSEWLFQPKHANSYFLNETDIAVKVDGKWRLFDPGSFQLPFGRVRWHEENQKALVCDSKEPLFIDVPALGPESNLERRRADLKLDEEGALAGTVKTEFTGHLAASRRLEIDGWKLDQREKELREKVTSRIEGAEVSDIEVRNLEDPEKPLLLSYRIRIPGYAARAGKRLILAPAFFQRGVAARYSASQRTHPLFIHIGWTNDDEVRIELPAGGHAPDIAWAEPFKMGEFGEYRPAIALEGRTLVYRRAFRFTGGIFPVSDYPPLKKAFETLHAADNREIAITFPDKG